ncbi:MAG TPA: DoxX family protein, partial [Anaerolineae bacterium]|nr:DoxX family protein [Anaerolineae bacterium]
SSNPLMFLFSSLLFLAWKVGGWYGLDRWLLPRLGTPWTRSAATAADSSATQSVPAD